MRNEFLDIKVTESAPTEPVTLTEVKAWATVDGDSFDTMLTALIIQCRKAIEQKLNVSLVPKTIVFYANWCTAWELPRMPHAAITEVAIRDGVDSSNDPVYTALSKGTDWTWEGEISKRLCVYKPGVLRITYTAGYGNSGLVIPDDLKNGLLQEIAYRFEHRGDEKGMKISEGAMSFLEPHINYAW